MKKEGRKDNTSALLGHWAHGSATDRSKNGLGKSVDDITLHLSTPTDCQIDIKRVGTSPRRPPQKQQESGARALFDFTETMR